MLNWEFERFVGAWMERANDYADDQNGCYDKFFTLFVVFNRLYSEAAFELDRQGVISLKKNRPLPDKKGATEYTLNLVGQERFDQMYEANLVSHVETVARLIEDEMFCVRLGSPGGERQPEKDRELLGELRSTGRTRALQCSSLSIGSVAICFMGIRRFILSSWSCCGR